MTAAWAAMCFKLGSSLYAWTMRDLLTELNAFLLSSLQKAKSGLCSIIILREKNSLLQPPGLRASCWGSRNSLSSTLFSETTILCRTRRSGCRMPRGRTDSCSLSFQRATVRVARNTR